jgi:hypothetical protein
MPNFLPAACEATSFDVLENRCFGVEIETAYSPKHVEFEGSAFGAKDDCSITGKEFYSSILNGDSGLAAVLEFCAKAQEKGYMVDHKCGLHVHVDMRNESTESMKAIALAFLLLESAFQALVAQYRVPLWFCKPHRKGTVDRINGVDDWTRFANSQDKMQWINFSAYNNHTTFENRLHQGTLDPNDRYER